MITSRCFPSLQRMNEMREEYFYVNYRDLDVDIPLEQSVQASLSHKAITLICLPANAFVFGASALGMFGSCLLASLKVSIYIATGEKLTFSTGFSCLSNNLLGSGCHFFRNIGEIGFEYFHRIFSAYQKLNLGCRENWSDFSDWKTLKPIQDLNRCRVALRERTFVSFFLHKVISVISIPANIGGIAASTLGMLVSVAFLLSKISLYVFIGIQIKHSTGFLKNFKIYCVSLEQLSKNIKELGKDFIFLLNGAARLFGMHGTIERVRNFVSNPVQQFSEILT